jgi:hypothetical protein
MRSVFIQLFKRKALKLIFKLKTTAHWAHYENGF